MTSETFDVAIRDASGSPISGFEGMHNVTPIEGLEVEFAVGDMVYFTAGEDGQIFDAIVDGQPSRSDRIRSLVFPKVEEIYEGVER